MIGKMKQLAVILLLQRNRTALFCPMTGRTACAKEELPFILIRRGASIPDSLPLSA